MTRPIKTITRWEKIKKLTVWHPINTDPKDDDRWTVRVWLPLYDFLVILGGWNAYTIGSPLMNRLFPAPVVDAMAIAFAFSGFIAMLGVVIPRLWRVEIGGKVIISFLLTTYALLVLSFHSQNAENNSFITVILIMATWGVYPRLTKLFIRGYRASAARKAAKKA